MKTILLTAAAILTITFSSKADDNKSGINTDVLKKLVAPMVIGNPDEAPAELKSLLAYPSAVPVAPVIPSNPDEEVPVELKNIPAYPVKVPVAPMVIGNPDDEAPIELSSMPAYAAN